MFLEITGEDKDRLIAALDLAHVDRVSGIWQEGNKLVLGRPDDNRLLSFSPRLLADTIIDWLKRSRGLSATYQSPDFGKEPDIDGDCKRGWRLICKGRTIEVHPQWMVYHK